MWLDPNFAFDAARIYISQKTDVDKNFDLANHFQSDRSTPDLRVLTRQLSQLAHPNFLLTFDLLTLAKGYQIDKSDLPFAFSEFLT